MGNLDRDQVTSLPPTPESPPHDPPTLPKDWEKNRFVRQLAEEKVASTKRKTSFGRDYRGSFWVSVSCVVHPTEDWISPIRLTADEIAAVENQLKVGLQRLNLRLRSARLSLSSHGQREQIWNLQVEVG